MEPNLTPSFAPSVADAPKPKRTGIAGLFPDWLIDNSARITNAGLTFFTGTMLYSGYRGKQISTDIWNKQLDLIKTAEGMTPDRAAKLVETNIQNRTMLRPGWHKMRLAYLLTAMTSFAFGAFFQRKEETPEQMESYQRMSLPEYMRTRTQQALDPIGHSRQTVGVLSSASGVMAVMSALSQPGGTHKSELYVGSTLAAGGALLAYINDAKTAQNAFSTLWMARFPAILTGTRESLFLKPAFKNPHVAEMKTTQAYQEGVQNALQHGADEKIWLGLRTVKRHGADAVRVFDKGFGTERLGYERRDYTYPFGQWGNFISASIGFLGKRAKAKDAAAINPANTANDNKTLSPTPAEKPPVDTPLTANDNKTPQASIDAGSAEVAKLQHTERALSA